LNKPKKKKKGGVEEKGHRFASRGEEVQDSIGGKGVVPKGEKEPFLWETKEGKGEKRKNSKDLRMA